MTNLTLPLTYQTHETQEDQLGIGKAIALHLINPLSQQEIFS